MSTIDKAERYEWAKPGDRGKTCMMPIDSLKIDHTYQRSEVTKNNTLSIARDFNWIAFGNVVVMERDNGDRYVVDGQQRLLAAKHRGDIIAVPCIVFKSTGPEHEAKAFLALNTKRKFVTAIDKFNASVLVGAEPEKQIADWLSEVGMKISKDGKDTNTIYFPGKLISAWKWNGDACRRAILIQREINGPGETMNNVLFMGIFWLINHGIRVEEHVEKIVRLGGKLAILRSANSVLIESGTLNGMKWQFAGIGVLRLINHKRQRRITVKGEHE